MVFGASFSKQGSSDLGRHDAPSPPGLKIAVVQPVVMSVVVVAVVVVVVIFLVGIAMQLLLMRRQQLIRWCRHVQEFMGSNVNMAIGQFVRGHGQSGHEHWIVFLAWPLLLMMITCSVFGTQLFRLLLLVHSSATACCSGGSVGNGLHIHGDVMVAVRSGARHETALHFRPGFAEPTNRRPRILSMAT